MTRNEEGGKMKLNYVDHICIATKDIKKAEEHFSKAFGTEAFLRYADPDEKINVVCFRIGQTVLEFMEDSTGDGETANFIQKRGEGIMLVSFNVDNCESALEELKKKKVRLIDQKPRVWKEYKRRFAFLHPAETHGALMEVIDGEYPK
jgi:methylmalonyl-CoA/ethylmalonyl-CoA epimerase